MADQREAKAESVDDLRVLRNRFAQLQRASRKLQQTDCALRETERCLKAMMNAVTESALLIETDGTVVAINEVMAERLDATIDEVVGRSIYDFLPRDIAESRKLQAERVVRTGQPIQFDDIRSGRLVHNSVYPVLDSSGKVARLAVVGLDIDERKKAEETLHQSERKYSTLCDNIPAMIYRARPDWSTQVISGSESLSGYSPEEFHSQQVNWLNIVHPDDKERVLHDASELGKQRTSIIQKYRIVAKDGSIHWVEDHKTSVFEKGVFQGVDGVAFDITDREEIAETLRESELHYRTLFESLPIGVGVSTTEGCVLNANSAMLMMTGYSAAEIGQISLNDTYANRQERVRLMKELQTNGLVRDFETQLKRKDGTAYWASLTLIPWVWAGQDAHLAVAVDITRQKEAAEEIRKLNSAVEQSIDGIAIGDLKPTLLYVNNAFARMHGFTPEEMIGMPVRRLHNHDKQQRVDYKKAMSLLTTTGSWHGEINHVKKDGTLFPAYMSITLLKDDGGKPTGTLAVTRDITESKRTDEELGVFREKMVRAERLASLGVLSATLAHELSQPLTVVRLSIDNALAELETGFSSTTVGRRLRDGLDGLSSATSLLDRVRRLGKESSERNASKVCLKEVAERTVILLSETAHRAKVRLVLKDLDTLPPVYLYKNDLEQLFFALVQNAIQASDGRRRHRLSISGTAKKRKYVKLRFADTCGGIASENLDRIFDPFFTTKPPGIGTGLGLCIVQDVVSRVGGGVAVNSRPGAGSTFVVTLPVKAKARL
jgi:PAS domain S-box-containing protein